MTENVVIMPNRLLILSLLSKIIQESFIKFYFSCFRYANNESYSRALDDFSEARKINPKHANAIKYMHETLLAKGKKYVEILI